MSRAGFRWLGTYGGNKAAFARAINRPAPNVHRMLTESDGDKRGIGEDLARDIETKLFLPPGYLDQAEGAGIEADPTPLDPQTIPALLHRLAPEISQSPRSVQDALTGLLTRYQEDPAEGERIAKAINVLLKKDD